MIDTRMLTDLWDVRYEGVQPIGHHLRHNVHDRWVRFHSLPQSQRYATNDAEHAEIRRRHLATLDALIQHQPNTPPDDLVLAITPTHTRTTAVPEPAARADIGWLPAQHWTSIDASDPDFTTWMHLYVTETSLASDHLGRLLRMVADDQVHDMIVAARDLTWLYHPYDGGADVIAPDQNSRRAFQDQFSDWLPDTPSGL